MMFVRFLHIGEQVGGTLPLGGGIVEGLRPPMTYTCVCTCIYAHVYIYIHVHDVYMHIYIDIDINIYISIYIMYMYMSTCTTDILMYTIEKTICEKSLAHPTWAVGIR